MMVCCAAVLLTLSNAQMGEAFTVSSPFGWRVHPVTGKWQFHTGVDIPASYGSRIRALFDGEVVWAENHRGYGNTVLLRHINNTYTLYGHCARLYVKRGQVVQAGEWIASVGSTGVSTGPHFHLEYWVNHQYVDPMLLWQVNPGRTEKERRESQ